MILQFDISKEIQFLSYILIVIIGIQVSLSFFYKYIKMKDVNLPLNRILLAFGSFIFFIIIGPLFIQISRLFIEDYLLNDLIYRLGWGIVFFSTITPSLFIIRKDFSIVTNLNYAKILLILNFIPIIALFLLPSIKSPLFFVTIIFAVTNGLYIVHFIVILIKKSIGKIKKKFKLFFIGAIVSIPSLIFAALVGAGILPPVIHELVYFTGISELLIGFIIIYFSLVDFPPFYEFEWRSNLEKIFIINNDNKECFFYYDFKNIQINEIDISTAKNSIKEIEDILPGGIIGIEQIVSTITKSDKEKINIIRRKNSIFCIDQSEKFPNLTYILIIKKELVSIYHFLNLIKKQFEEIYKEILLNAENLKEDKYILLSNFSSVINNLL
ncbi:MAG: hypothetical protein JXA99_11040 [Candidatus Lokiarchaeota archaeon]|nr:hypothetical protein [Candidatus Lokiarchaeota archaeon]